MNHSRYSWPLFAGIIWSILFALMSFYWASGGMIGAATLGGEIYRMAIARENDFVLIVWLTGILKLVGGLLLGTMLGNWEHKFFIKTVYFVAFVSGILLFLYGLVNFSTVLLSIINLLEMKIDSYAKWWRLLFWEPYWMLGGILYIISSRRFAMKSKRPRQVSVIR
ncbi:DUF3995 domain-containing protein [Cohnella pontilimi]|uniref:DUF3995 domain-containing protein n=1 Tax=Cohnella pontilimi TaxID=2564100 RepID=A0A4V6WEI8_9BACL|nr:DUF3995 domain-containing protein [Cohnella pontilimi]TJY43859.1 DUF3995 domain-containing protein [Cohnella pontilimi]